MKPIKLQKCILKVDSSDKIYTRGIDPKNAERPQSLAMLPAEKRFIRRKNKIYEP